MNMTVISPLKSSTVIMPYGLPLDLATRCCTLVMRPAIVTWSPSCRSSEVSRSWIDVDACFASATSSPASG